MAQRGEHIAAGTMHALALDDTICSRALHVRVCRYEWEVLRDLLRGSRSLLPMQMAVEVHWRTPMQELLTSWPCPAGINKRERLRHSWYTYAQQSAGAGAAHTTFYSLRAT